jgi:ribonuclease HI
MNEDLIIHTDGGARGNPGPASCAFVAEHRGKIVSKNAKFLGKTTNNIAEYQGIIFALTWLVDNLSYFPVEVIKIFLDSELVAKQINGLFKIKNENLRNLFFTIKKLEKQTGKKIFYKNIPREKNRMADLLVNKELDKFS